jgi:hypothetical protein
MRDTLTENRSVSISTSRVENFVELSVSDRGSGIPEDKLKKVFEPFYTSKSEGMGMGLSIARTIVEAHDGRIWAENRPYGGALFVIRLPLDGNQLTKGASRLARTQGAHRRTPVTQKPSTSRSSDCPNLDLSQALRAAGAGSSRCLNTRPDHSRSERSE